MKSLKTKGYESIYIFPFFILVICFFCCKKEKEERVNYASSMYGTWKVSKLVIDGIDTLDYYQRDSTCFSYLRFYNSINGFNSLETIPVDTTNNSGYHCGITGGFSAYNDTVYFHMNSNPNSIGPFLSDDPIYWKVIFRSSDMVKLTTNNNCFLDIEKI